MDILQLVANVRALDRVQRCRSKNTSVGRGLVVCPLRYRCSTRNCKYSPPYQCIQERLVVLGILALPKNSKTKTDMLRMVAQDG